MTGDEYATAIYTAIRKNWNIPTGLITDTELAGLAAEVRLSILGDGTLAHTEMRNPRVTSISTTLACRP